MIIIKKTELKKVKKFRIQLGVNMKQIVCKDTRIGRMRTIYFNTYEKSPTEKDSRNNK